MNKTIISRIILLMLLFAGTVSAQETNKIYIGDLRGMKSSTFDMPINVDNTNNNIVAAQMEVRVPYGLTLNTSVTTLNDQRIDGHRLRSTLVSSASSEGQYSVYRFMLLSPTNKPLKANKGQLFSVQAAVSASASFVEGRNYLIFLDKPVLSDSLGRNVVTDSDGGVLYIEPSPDFVIKDLNIVSSSSFMPGDSIEISWTVKNQGTADSRDGWSEQAYLVPTGTDKAISLGTTTHHSGSLAAGASVQRSCKAVIPRMPRFDGECKVRVRVTPYSNAGEPTEYRNNNQSTSSTSYTLGKKLYLRAAEDGYSYPEQNGMLEYSIERSGNTDTKLTLALIVSGDSRASAESPIIIQKGNSSADLRIKLFDDDIINDDDNFTYTVVGADGYEGMSRSFVLENNDYPELTLTAEKALIDEGDRVQMTVTSSVTAKDTVEVSLAVDKPSRFSMPTSVYIMPGEKAVSFEVLAIDDKVVSDTIGVRFSATAERYNRTAFEAMLTDNDMPELHFELSPTTISEGAGVAAILCTVERVTNIDTRVTINLSDDGNGDVYWPRRSITLEKGQTTAQFSIGAIDNDQMEGDRDVDVTAAVWISSCSCSAKGTSAGSVTQTITILDDDGPALKVEPQASTLLEGSTGNRIRIIRNTETSQPLNVTLSSNYDSELVYTPEATIAAGQKYVDVLVDVKRNDVAGDSKTIVFTATSNGYAKGTNWVRITDQTLPDAVITSFTLNADTVMSKQTVTATVVVANQGFNDMPAQTQVRFSYDGTDVDAYTENVLPVGEEVELTAKFNMPDTPKNYSVSASINPAGKFLETLTSNNNAQPVNITVVAPFTATAEVEREVYNQYEVVYISGQATGYYNTNAKVEVYLLNNNVRDTISAITDGEGKYRAAWIPTAGVSGHFNAGACYPGERLTTEMTSFDVYGLRRAYASYLKHEIYTKTTEAGIIDLYNPGNLDLHDLQISFDGDMEGIEVSVTPPGDLLANQKANIHYTITGVEATQGKKEYHNFTAHITTREGAKFDQVIYYWVHPSYPKLKASVKEINTTMVKGSSRTFQFDLTNEGKEVSGDITIDWGNISWITAATPKTMPSLDFCDTTTVVLVFTPTDDMQLNNPLRGTIAINGANGGGFSLPFRIEPVSDATGRLIVDVCDEATYNTEEAPHVAGATVTIQHPATGKVLYTGTTGDDGLYTLDLNEGYYRLVVSEQRHSTYSEIINVNAGRDNNVIADISISGITVEMTYEETEIEDEYNIVTTVVYETNVPAPVIKVDQPKDLPLVDMKDGDSFMYYVHMTNVGLIKGKNAHFFQPADFDGFTFTPLVQGPFEILPNQMVTIPILVEYNAPEESEEPAGAPRRKSGGVGCMTLNWKALVSVECGTKDLVKEQSGTQGTGGDRSGCGGGGGGFGGFGGGGGIGSPSGGGGGGGGTSSIVQKLYEPGDGKGHCNECFGTFAKTLISRVVTTFIPIPIWDLVDAWECGWGVGQSGTSIANGTATGKQVGESIWSCVKTFVPKIVGERLEKVTGVVTDVIDIYRACHKSDSDSGGGVSGGAHAPQRPRHSYALFMNPPTPHPNLPSWANVYREKLNVWRNYIFSYKNSLDEFFGDGYPYEDVEGNANAVLFDAISQARDAGLEIDENSLYVYKPNAITEEQFHYLIQRLHNSFDLEEEEAIATGNFIDFNALASHVGMMYTCDTLAQLKYGYEGAWDLAVNELKIARQENMKGENSVCSKVKLEIEQKMTMTRQAVRGTLTVTNGSTEAAMTDVKLNLVVLDPEGEVAGTRLMTIAPESLNGFQGSLDLQSGWTLGAQETGVAKILFIPTKYAAPDVPVPYTFMGTISYVDPFTGLETTRELEPATLEVRPSPNLDLTYFMQRDIFGDDPLTEEVEPMVPSQFSLLINNKGNGDATNVKMVTQQPKIVENEKGLLVEFEILSSQLNGGDKVLALGEAVTTDFGTIPAHSQTYAQWWMQCSLTGHFTSYDVNATHVTSYGNPDLSLLDSVTIHELIHSIKVPANNGTNQKLVGFVCNDESDANDTPDKIYFSNATTAPVDIAFRSNIGSLNKNKATLTAEPKQTGWTYGYVRDPSAGKRKIIGIRRLSDNAEIDLDNFWQTDRTLRDGADPLYENLIHYVDSINENGDSYELTFEDRPDTILVVQSYEGIPDQNNEYVRQPITKVTVNFNKAIDASTLNSETISLRYAGELLDASKIVITKKTDRQFELGLTELTTGDGYYQLTVQTANIRDHEGYLGDASKMAAWIQATDGKVNLFTKVQPEGAGTVTPTTGPVDYNSTVNLKATANHGYTFSHWTDRTGQFSKDAETTYEMNGEQTITAVFTPQRQTVTINYNVRRGTVTGGGTGFYDYGTKLELKATVSGDNLFMGWRLNGEIVATTESYTLLVNDDITLEAVFEPMPDLVSITIDENEYYSESPVTDGGYYNIYLRRQLSPDYWNTFCSPFTISEVQVTEIFGSNTAITEFVSMEGDVMQFEDAREMRAGVPYLVKPEKSVRLPGFVFKGNIETQKYPEEVMRSGYGYVGIYGLYQMNDDGTELFLGTNGNLYKPKKEGASPLKGMRAYFIVPQGQSARLSIDGITTAIDDLTIDGELPTAVEGVYDLQGRKIAIGTLSERQLPKGVYIINGKKTVIK